MIEYTLEYTDSNKQKHSISARIETHLENVRDNILRTGIIAGIAKTTVPEEDALLAYLYYPVCVSCSDGTITLDDVEFDVRKLTLAQFAALPGPLFVAWSDRVLADNPHFLEVSDVEKPIGVSKKKRK